MRSSHAAPCRRPGFTLLELVLVIALAGVLAGIAIPIYRGYRERAMNRRAAVEIQMISALVVGPTQLVDGLP